MKKILIFIVWILWIWLSFCSADSWYNYNINWVWNEIWSTDNYEMNFFVNSPYSLNQLDEICFQWRILYSDISNWIAVVWLWDWKYYYSDWKYLLTWNSEFSTYCYTFSTPLKFTSYQKIYYWLHNTELSSFDFSPYRISWILRQTVYILNGWSYPASYMTWSYYNVWKQNINFLWCNKDVSNLWTVSTPLYWYSYSEVSTPKFKVNYWSTSYEYDLEDNLEIHLNSPVLKDGDNYFYDWSTWINLFYNWISQFYDKSELYLFTPSWYSANIFNPICL